MFEPQIIYESENFLAVVKPAGLITHPVKAWAEATGKHERALTDWLTEKYPELAQVGDDPEWRPGIVHRLDKETSGIMLIPRTQAYFEYLKGLFQNHAVKKTYLALVSGVPKEKEGRIEMPIGIMEKTTKRSVHSEKMAKEAITNYRVKKVFETSQGKFSLLEVEPETGRTHQIRIHLKAIDCPVVGDALYGPKNPSLISDRLMLHAYALEFEESPGKKLKIEAEPPAEFEKMLENLSTGEQGKGFDIIN